MITQNPEGRTQNSKEVPGGITGGATPVPIPNTEVKPSKADDTAAVRQWESRTLPGYNKGPLVERSAGLSFSDWYAGVPRLSGSHTFRSDPFGLGGRKPSGIPSVAICDRSASVSSSFPSQRSLGGSPLLRCQVALSLGTPATRERLKARCLAPVGLWIYKTALR